MTKYFVYHTQGNFSVQVEIILCFEPHDDFQNSCHLFHPFHNVPKCRHFLHTWSHHPHWREVLKFICYVFQHAKLHRTYAGHSSATWLVPVRDTTHTLATMHMQITKMTFMQSGCRETMEEHYHRYLQADFSYTKTHKLVMHTQQW